MSDEISPLFDDWGEPVAWMYVRPDGSAMLVFTRQDAKALGMEEVPLYRRDK